MMPESVPQASAEHEPAGPSARPELAPPDWDEIEQMLDELPPGIPILPPEDATNFSKYRYPPPMMPAPQAWKICTDAMEKYDSELCKAYREEIDTLLVFAGLFSAVVTAFTIESYQWLQGDPSDTTNALLAQIARSLATNGTAVIPPSSSGLGSSASARINAYWFISLALSLSTALVAILSKQWVREFERRAADMTPQQVVGARQLKLEGLEYWKVGEIISALPMLLQLSLALFAVGILELLWHLHVAVAVALCIPTALVMLFYLTTTIIPVLQYSQRHTDRPLPPQCAYKSPQALAVIHVYQIVAGAWNHIHRRLSVLLWRHGFHLPSGLSPVYDDQEVWIHGWTASWSKWDSGFCVTDRYMSEPPSRFRGLDWLSKNVDEHTVRQAYWNCLWDEAHPADSHYDNYGRGGPREGDTRLRHWLLYTWSDIKEAFSLAPLWQCALPSMTRTDMAQEVMSEVLIQGIPTMDVPTATAVFSAFHGAFARDSVFIRSLVRAVLSYGREHIDEDILQVMFLTTEFVARCSDYATESALQWVAISLAVNWLDAHWLDAQVRRSDRFSYWQLSRIRSRAFDMLSRSPKAFVRHPVRLHHLPHILALAALLRAEYERNYGPITWPMSLPADIWTYKEGFLWDLRREWEPMVMEIFKISVCGVRCDNSIVHEAPSPPAALPPVGALGKPEADAETAPSRDAGTASRHSHEDTLSATKRPGIARAVDAASAPTLDIVVVPAERDAARTSAYGALLGSHVVEDAGAQDAGCGSALALSEREGGDSMGVAAMRAVRDLPEVYAAPPQAASGSTPHPTGDLPAVPASPCHRHPLAPALPEKHARETAHADEPEGHIATHDEAEKLASASDVRAVIPPLQATTIDFADGRSSAMSDDADVSRTLEDETVTGAGGDSVLSANIELSSIAHTEQAEPSIRLEPHCVHRASGTESRTRDVASTDERHARTGSIGPAGKPGTLRGERPGETDDTPQHTARAGEPSGHMLEASSIRLEPDMGKSTAADAASLHPDDQSAAEGTREQPDEIGGRGEPLGA